MARQLNTTPALAIRLTLDLEKRMIERQKAIGIKSKTGFARMMIEAGLKATENWKIESENEK